jgi:hypothetical protein
VQGVPSCRKRVRQAEADGGLRGELLTSSERQRLRELEPRSGKLRANVMRTRARPRASSRGSPVAVKFDSLAVLW